MPLIDRRELLQRSLPSLTLNATPEHEQNSSEKDPSDFSASEDI
jgi:hypothetical protein